MKANKDSLIPIQPKRYFKKDQRFRAVREYEENSGHLLFFEAKEPDINRKNGAFRGKKLNQKLVSKPICDSSIALVQPCQTKVFNTSCIPLPKGKKCHWEPLSAVKGNDVKIMAGKSEGRSNYFRVFSNNVPAETKTSKTDPAVKRMKELLPYRFHKTARLYGVSPLVLIVKSTPKKIGPKTKPKVVKGESSNRLAGPELAPAMADFNEFPDMFTFESRTNLNSDLSLAEIEREQVIQEPLSIEHVPFNLMEQRITEDIIEDKLAEKETKIHEHYFETVDDLSKDDHGVPQGNDLQEVVIEESIVVEEQVNQNQHPEDVPEQIEQHTVLQNKQDIINTSITVAEPVIQELPIESVNELPEEEEIMVDDHQDIIQDSAMQETLSEEDIDQGTFVLTTANIDQ
jgi:hypothetical protein